MGSKGGTGFRWSAFPNTAMENVGDAGQRTALDRRGQEVRQSVARASSIDLTPPRPVTMTCLLQLSAPTDLRALEAALRSRAESDSAAISKRTYIRYDPADGRAFKNQLTLRIVQAAEGCTRRRVISCKLFAKGLVHMTGPRTLEEVMAAWKTLRHFVRGLFEASPPDLTVTRCSPVMMNSTCKVTKSGAAEGRSHVIVPKKLIAAVRYLAWLERSPRFTCAYDPSVYSGIKIKRDVGTLMVFSSGSVVISSRTTEGTWKLWMMLGAIFEKDPTALRQVAVTSRKERKDPEERVGALAVDYDAGLLAL